MQNVLLEVYQEIYGDINQPGKMKNLTDLANKLSGIAGKEPPWTARYLTSIINGSVKMSAKFGKAVNALASQIDGDPPLKGRITKQVTVYSINGLEDGSIILGHSKRCKYCTTLFVGKVPNQEYCVIDCRKEARRLRRKENK